MSVRIRYGVEAAVSSTDAEEKDLGNVNSEVVADVFNEGGTFKSRVPAGAVNLQIPLNGITTANFLMIRINPTNPQDTPASVFIRRNLITAEEIEIAPFQKCPEGHFLLTTTGITALYASNPGTVDMDFTYTVVGD